MSPLTFSSHMTLSVLKEISPWRTERIVPASSKTSPASIWLGGGGGTDEREVSNKMYSMQQIFKKVTCFGVQLDWTWTVWENNYVYVPRRSISPNISVFGSGIVWPFCAFPSHCAPVYKTAVFNGEPKSSRTHPKSRTHPNLRKVFNSIMLIVHACLHWATF